MIISIKITKKAEKELKKTPLHIREKFTFWVRSVNKVGLMKTRKCLGWHDEPLYKDKNRSEGQRSIRLNKQWRAIYIIKENNEMEFIEVIEVMPHEY